jgi:hypothetical protein
MSRLCSAVTLLCSKVQMDLSNDFLRKWFLIRKVFETNLNL